MRLHPNKLATAVSYVSTQARARAPSTLVLRSGKQEQGGTAEQGYCV